MIEFGLSLLMFMLTKEHLLQQNKHISHLKERGSQPFSRERVTSTSYQGHHWGRIVHLATLDFVQEHFYTQGYGRCYCKGQKILVQSIHNMNYVNCEVERNHLDMQMRMFKDNMEYKCNKDMHAAENARIALLNQSFIVYINSNLAAAFGRSSGPISTRPITIEALPLVEAIPPTSKQLYPPPFTWSLMLDCVSPSAAVGMFKLVCNSSYELAWQY